MPVAGTVQIMFVSSLFSSPWWSLLAALALGAASWPLVRFASRRTLTRPVAFAPAAEETLLAGLVGDLRRWPYVAQVEPADFAATHHHNLWQALTAVLGADAVVGEKASDAECEALAAALAERHDEVWARVHTQLGGSPQPDVDRERLAELHLLAATTGLCDVDEVATASADAAVVDAAEEVLASGNDRNRLAGTGVVVPSKVPNSTDVDAPPLVRTWTAPSVLRYIASAGCLGVVGALLPGWLALLPGDGTAATVFAAGALVMLAAMSLVVSLVDIDTLYIDVPVWAAGTGAAWLFAVATAFAAGEPARIWIGLVMVLAVGFLFEGLNLVFRLVRGVDGQGFGDTLVIVATVGIPPVLAADYRLGYWSVMAGFIAVVVGWGAARLAGRVRRNTPFAFGPFLAAGWVLAMVWFVYDATFMLAMR